MKNKVAKWTAIAMFLVTPVAAMAQNNVSAEFAQKPPVNMLNVLGRANWTIGILNHMGVIANKENYSGAHSISDFGKCKVMGTLLYSDTEIKLIRRSETLINRVAVDPKVKVAFFSKSGKRVERIFPLIDDIYSLGEYPELDKFVYEEVINTGFCD